MLNIRLSRKGKKKQPIFRVLICEKAKDPWGKYLENLGFYNPRTKEMVLKTERLKYWLSKGAQPSTTLWNIFIDQGLVEGKKKKVSKISKSRAAKIAAEVKKAEPIPSVPATPEKEIVAKPEVKAETTIKTE